MPQATWQADSPLTRQICKYLPKKKKKNITHLNWHRQILFKNFFGRIRYVSTGVLNGLVQLLQLSLLDSVRTWAMMVSQQTSLRFLDVTFHPEPSTIDVSPSHCQSSLTSTPPSVLLLISCYCSIKKIETQWERDSTDCGNWMCKSCFLSHSVRVKSAHTLLCYK